MKSFTSHVNIIKSYVNPSDRPDDHDYDPDQTLKQGETGEEQEMIRILDLMRQRINEFEKLRISELLKILLHVNLRNKHMYVCIAEKICLLKNIRHLINHTNFMLF